jgi:hypothetical protein
VIELSDTQRQIVLAMLAQLALAAALLIMLPIPRILAIRAGKVRRDEHGRPIFPKWATQLSDCFNNQFQVPTLFYVVCILALWLHAETEGLAWAAWAFVVLRWAHAAIFATSNYVPIRFPLFVASGIIFLLMLLQMSRRILGV